MNYFEYFTEIEQQFTARRGSLLLLSPLDWALIETWREADVPLAAVLRGIDTAFDKYDARKSRTSKAHLRKVNGLAWCAQAVMEAAAAMAEARVGAHAPPERPPRKTGFESERLGSFLEANAAALECEAHPGTGGLQEALRGAAARLRELAGQLRTGAGPAPDELDRTLTVMEERLQATLVAAVPEEELLRVRGDAERELAALRGLGAVQRRQVRDQYVHKQLFRARRLPRLSLFYMPVDDEPPQEGAP